jgi:hypothetical protein
VIHAQFGEPCFCDGPVAVHRGHLYRQSVGIEVFDLADPIAPVRVGMADERTSSRGELVIVDDNLISLGEFPATVRAYSLGDPASPSFLGSLALPMDGRPAAMAAMGHGVIAASVGVGTSVVYGILLAPASMPRILWEAPIPGEVESIAVDGMFGYVLSTRRDVGMTTTTLTVLELGGGGVVLERTVDTTESFGRRIGLGLGLVAITGRDPALRAFRVNGTALTPLGTLPTDGSWAFGIAVDDGLALVAGGPFQIVSLAGGTPVTLGRTDTPSDTFHVIFGEARDVAYVSGGNGTSPVTLGCSP